MPDLVPITLRTSLEEIIAVVEVEAAKGGCSSTTFFDAFDAFDAFNALSATLIALSAAFLASLLVVRFL